MELQPLRYDYIVCNLRNLKKLVIKSKTNLTLLDYQPFDLVKIYERRRTNATTICYGNDVSGLTRTEWLYVGLCSSKVRGVAEKHAEAVVVRCFRKHNREVLECGSIVYH